VKKGPQKLTRMKQDNSKLIAPIKGGREGYTDLVGMAFMGGEI
jgi:hypothetical protein